ncbi:MAG: RpiB/LacA/LacB family sugar-phosphate isomerase [Planctomycetota bacterium]
MKVGIATDHAGYELKEELLPRLKESSVEVEDFGAYSCDSEDDYPDRVVPLARAVAEGKVDRGIVVCGTGVGACVASNKVKGVRACLMMDTYSVRQGVEHAHLNVLCLGGRVMGVELAWELTRTFLTSDYGDGKRHCRRLKKVKEVEQNT